MTLPRFHASGSHILDPEEERIDGGKIANRFFWLKSGARKTSIWNFRHETKLECIVGCCDGAGGHLQRAAELNTCFVECRTD